MKELGSSNAEINTSPENTQNVRITQFVAGPYLHEEEIEAIVAMGRAIVIHGTGLGHLPR